MVGGVVVPPPTPTHPSFLFPLQEYFLLVVIQSFLHFSFPWTRYVVSQPSSSSVSLVAGGVVVPTLPHPPLFFFSIAFLLVAVVTLSEGRVASHME